MTLDMINRASMIVFLVMGAGKAQIIGRLLQPKTEADRKLPAALVRPHQGHVIWLLDRPAAAALTTMSN
ncbi:hypothetical protein W02_26140 [Nitrospira sp. KM1]|nr:hypothetical protein W02_26140 [Nitrospira sp. KM1]